MTRRSLSLLTVAILLTTLVPASTAELGAAPGSRGGAHAAGLLPGATPPTASAPERAPDAPAEPTATATVPSAPDPEPAADADEGTPTPPPPTDSPTEPAAGTLDLSSSSKAVSAVEAPAGAVLTYTLDIVNSGNASQLVLVTDPIPQNTTYVPGSAVNGTYDGNQQHIYWAGTMAANSRRQITFCVQLDADLEAGAVITNRALIDDFSQELECLATTTIIEPRWNLQTSVKSVAPAVARSGDLLTYTIALTNTGILTATACITDPIPAGTSFAGGLSASAGTPAYDPDSDAVQWCGLVPPDASAWVQFTAQVTVPATDTATITNVATIADGVEAPWQRSATTLVPLLWLESATSEPYVGGLVDVHLRLSNVADLQSVEAHIDFPPTVLEAVEFLPGDWLSPADWIHRWDDIAGTIDLLGILAEGSGASGSGILGTLRLRAKSTDPASLTLADTCVSTRPPPDERPLPHHVRGCTIPAARAVPIYGQVILQGRATDHSGAEVWVDGEQLATTVADGTFTFSAPRTNMLVTLYMPGYLSAWRQITATGALTLPTATLLGGDAVGGNVTIRRDAACSGTLTDTVPGLPDGLIDIQDLTFVANKLGMTSADPWWGPDPCFPRYGEYDPRNFSLAYTADINGDGRVNIQDLTAACANYRRAAPSPWP